MIASHRFLPRFLLAAALPLAIVPGCEKPPPPPPVVHVAPVFTRPFEDGYKAGFDQGAADSRPRAKVPPDEAIQAKAAEAAVGDDSHVEKWQRGWKEGYLDGFRDVASHKK